MNYALHFSNLWERNYKNGEPLRRKTSGGNLKGIWSCRIGKYRILYEIKESTKEILVEALGLRKNVYD